MLKLLEFNASFDGKLIFTGTKSLSKHNVSCKVTLCTHNVNLFFKIVHLVFRILDVSRDKLALIVVCQWERASINPYHFTIVNLLHATGDAIGGHRAVFCTY